jgi:ubiquinone/menaquinone biosynthesis C-methylase UbiE
MTFKDLFSGHSEEYSQHRPVYPPELFEYLSSIVSSHETAWDCATGNGQAAIGLTSYFNKVYATDASEKQIAHAFPHPKIQYSTALAEKSGLPDSSVDLITLATAIHWIQLDKFEREVRRVLKPGGKLAVWNYTRIIINKEITAILDDYFRKILGNYWDPKLFDLLNDESLYELPFKKIESPEIPMISYWNFGQVINYLGTWSGAQKFIKENNSDPLNLIYEKIKLAWGDENKIKKINWKYFLRVYDVHYEF